VTAGQQGGLADSTASPGEQGANRRVGPKLDAGGYRLALLVLLTLLAAVGLHAGISRPAWGSHTKVHDVRVAIALEAIAVALFVVLVVRNRRGQFGPLVATRLRTALLYLLGAGILALAITLIDLLVNIHVPSSTGHIGRSAGIPAPPPLRLPRSSPSGSSNFPFNQVLFGLIAALLLAAIVAVAVRAFRQRRVQTLPEYEPPAEDYGDTLQDAILGGQRALLELDDARTAIIACYVAMEESLARAGTARSVAETPDELLAKAAGQLLISATAATRLTSLFYEARFSTHPLDNSQKEAAERALSELAAELNHRRAVPSGAEL
jgi:Domain of unknown function (DUF4129)